MILSNNIYGKLTAISQKDIDEDPSISVFIHSLGRSAYIASEGGSIIDSINLVTNKDSESLQEKILHKALANTAMDADGDIVNLNALISIIQSTVKNHPSLMRERMLSKVLYYARGGGRMGLRFYDSQRHVHRTLLGVFISNACNKILNSETQDLKSRGNTYPIMYEAINDENELQFMDMDDELGEPEVTEVDSEEEESFTGDESVRDDDEN